jgi:hypothetical protein
VEENQRKLDPDTGISTTCNPGGENFPISASLAASGVLLASGWSDAQVRVFSPETCDLLLAVWLGGRPHVFFSPDARYLYVLDGGTIEVWRAWL